MVHSRVESARVTSASSLAPTSVGRAIEGLLLALAEPRWQGGAAQASSDPQHTAWEDEDYRYVEFAVESSEISFCDISIMEGKVFIRIAREADDAEPAEGLPRLATIVPIAAPLES